MKSSRFTFHVSQSWLGLLLAVAPAPSVPAETLWLENAVVHTVSGGILTNGSVLIDGEKISLVARGRQSAPRADRTIDLQGRHLYPGLIALDSALGLAEIAAVRATVDTTETGDFTPDVESWIAVNPDSELIPVARANGIAYFEPAPQGGIISGQSALLAMEGWTAERMIVRKPAALHVFWPRQELDTTPKELAPDPSKWKSLEDQARDRRVKLRGLTEFFEEATAYANAQEAARKGGVAAPRREPSWEAMLPYVRGELPIVIHADEIRQIRSAVAWAMTNRHRVCLAGGRDAALAADALAAARIPVIFEHIFTLPARDTDSYDVYFTTPEVLRRAGVRVVIGMGPDSSGAWNARNLPYAAAHAVAFGLPEDEALKGLTLHAARVLGVDSRLGSIEPGKEATLFACDGDILDLRTRVERMWIAGREASLENRQTRLYERYRNRPRPR